MASLYPFRALRPRPDAASAVAAVPYDVVSRDEARALADGNPLSFLRVSRAELELPADVDGYDPAVYARAATNFRALVVSAFEREAEPSLYLYRLRMGDHEQTGVAGCFSLDEYDTNIIKKHERTRRDKEDDRTRHMLALRAQTGPVFLTYRATADVNDIARRATGASPLIQFTAPDAVEHTIWRVSRHDRDALVAAFSRIAALYTADGHHRAASAARARDDTRTRGIDGQALGDDADSNTMLAVAFPHDQVQILAYNRVVTDLNGLNPEQFLTAVRQRFEIAPGPAEPSDAGTIAMFFNRSWFTLSPKAPPPADDPIASLDVSVLQEQLLAPVLGIVDVRTDKRIEFVGGIRGVQELERQVLDGKGHVAFSLFPVAVADLMAVSDANAIMPPKSTWFEPKLRDGLLVHGI